MKLILFILVLINLIYPQPKREFRGAWVTSVWNLDWPKTRGVSAKATQQSELINLLDQLKTAGFNAVLLQIRPNCDALYSSPYEPWSYWLTGTEGTAPNPLWDPLQFAIDEAHKRGMELHAWINPYRVSVNTSTGVHNSHPAKENPSWVLTVGNSKILNPGLQAVMDYVKMIVSDVVTRYDVDGIVFDDYFYPYPPDNITTEDQATFSAYPRGFTDIGNWRRNNVNLMVQSVYNEIKSIKPYVKFGISPAGIWKNNNPPGITGLQSYYDIFCDPIAWLNGGYIDYLSPQLYWKIGGSQDYIALSNWWADQCYSKNRVFVPSKSLNSTYTTSELPNQITHDRSNSKILGTIFYRADQVINNTLNLETELINNYYYNKSLPFALNWLNNISPNPPKNVNVVKSGTSNIVSWDPPNPSSDNDPVRYYVIYRSLSSNLDISNSANILDVVYATNLSYTDNNISQEVTYYYCITALDRYGNESQKSATVAPIPSLVALVEKKSSNSTLPAWFGNNTERGIAYTNGEVLVVSRSNGINIKRLNANTLEVIGEMNVNGISGGTFVLNDIETSWDDQILACNLTIDATNNFKIYKWNNLTSQPEVFINYANTSGLRLGDNFTVYGSISSNAAIYAAAANSTKVLKWTITNGVLNQNPTIINLSMPAGISNLTSVPSVAPFGFGNDDFYVNATNINPILYNSNGEIQGTINGAIIPQASTTIKTFVAENKRYLLAFLANNTAGDPNGQNLIIVDVTNGPASVTSANIYGKTNRLGDVSNSNMTGDICYRAVNGQYTIYLLATNNGITAYNCMAVPLPVEYVENSFSTKIINNQVHLYWETKSETNNEKFIIERFVNNEWKEIGSILAQGNNNLLNTYSFVDNLYGASLLRYRLKQLDYDGTYKYLAETFVSKNDLNYELYQNYPNPFNPVTNIRYYIAKDSYITLEIYNALGQKIATIFEGHKNAGEYQEVFDASNLTNGIYICKLTSGEYQKSIKMLLVK